MLEFDAENLRAIIAQTITDQRATWGRCGRIRWWRRWRRSLDSYKGPELPMGVHPELFGNYFSNYIDTKIMVMDDPIITGRPTMLIHTASSRRLCNMEDILLPAH